MARGLNKATLIGNLGADPETRQVGETNVTSLRIATSETFKDRSGEQWDKDGEKRYSTEIRVQQMLMLDAKAEGQPVTSTVDSDLPF